PAGDMERRPRRLVDDQARQAGRAERADHLRRDVRPDIPGGEPATQPHRDRDGRVVVRAGDVPAGEDHRGEHQADGQRGERGARQHRGADREDQEEGTDELGGVFAHGNQLGRISSRLVGRNPATNLSPTKTVGTIRMPFLISSSSRAGCSVVFFSWYLTPFSESRVLYFAHSGQPVAEYSTTSFIGVVPSVVGRVSRTGRVPDRTARRCGRAP